MNEIMHGNLWTEVKTGLSMAKAWWCAVLRITQIHNKYTKHLSYLKNSTALLSTARAQKEK